MSTRSMTYFVEGESPIAAFYRQSDGYIDGHGHELAEFLAGHTVTNGIGLREPGQRQPFNGLGDLAVRTIVAIKESFRAYAYGYVDGEYTKLDPPPLAQDIAGALYMVEPASKQYEEYNYFVSIRGGDQHGSGGEIWVKVFHGTWSNDGGDRLGDLLFEGTPEQLLLAKDADFDDESESADV